MISALCWVPRGATHLVQAPQELPDRLAEGRDEGADGVRAILLQRCHQARTQP